LRRTTSFGGSFCARDQRQRRLAAEIALPNLLDPVGIRELQRAFGQRLHQLTDSDRQPPQHRVRERDGPL